MKGYKLTKEVLSLLNLYLNNPLLVVLAANFHFAAVRGQDQ